MTRLLFIVEGQAEQEYVTRALVPHLAEFGVYATRPTLPITGRKGGTVFKGGGRSYGKLKHQLSEMLKEHRGADVRFTTMFDLYGIYPGFPGLAEPDSPDHTPRQRAERLEAAFARDIDDPRLIPHLQLHEFEAILLCNLDDFALEFEDAGRGITALKETVVDAGGPELVNEGEATAPSKRIEAQFARYPKLKTTVGVELAVAAGLPRIRSLCPHFDAWLRRLEALGSP